MYRISFRNSFIKRTKKFDRELLKKFLSKIELLKNVDNHSRLKVHKLHGRLAEYHSFSLDYNLRVVFRFESDDEILLVDVGTHDIYK